MGGASEPTLDKKSEKRIKASAATQNQFYPDPKMLALKNSFKNETQQKASALETYEEQLALAVKQKKMSKEKKAVFLQKIKDVAEGNMLSTEAVELTVDSRKTWIQVIFTSDVQIDISMLVAYISTDSRESATMKVSYTSCMATISNARNDYLEVCKRHLRRLISSALDGLEVPAHLNREDIERDLIEDGDIQLDEKLRRRS